MPVTLEDPLRDVGGLRPQGRSLFGQRDQDPPLVGRVPGPVGQAEILQALEQRSQVPLSRWRLAPMSPTVRGSAPPRAPAS